MAKKITDKRRLPCPDKCGHKYHCGDVREDGKKRRHSKRTGKPCKNPVGKKGGACRMHGRDSAKGEAHYNYKGKGTGKYQVPEKFKKQFSAFMESGALSLREELALGKSALNELYARVDTTESGATWKALRNNFACLVTAYKEEENLAPWLKACSRLIDKGMGFERQLEEIRRQEESVRRTTETEVKRINAEAGAMSADEVMMLVQRLVLLSTQAIRSVEAGEMTANVAISRMAEQLETSQIQ